MPIITVKLNDHVIAFNERINAELVKHKLLRFKRQTMICKRFVSYFLYGCHFPKLLVCRHFQKFQLNASIVVSTFHRTESWVAMNKKTWRHRIYRPASVAGSFYFFGLPIFLTWNRTTNGLINSIKWNIKDCPAIKTLLVCPVLFSSRFTVLMVALGGAEFSAFGLSRQTYSVSAPSTLECSYGVLHRTNIRTNNPIAFYN